MRQRTTILALCMVLLASTLVGCYTEEYNTQYFAAGAATCLSGKQLFFDDESGLAKSLALPHRNRYVSEQTTLPIDPTEHETVDFSQADPFLWVLPNEFADSDAVFATVFIGSDGTIAFESPGTGNSTLLDYYRSSQISILPVDATLGGSVRYAVVDETAVITYENVGGNTFQCELSFRNRATLLESIVFTYPMVGENTRAGVVGVQSASVPQDALETFLAIAFDESNLCEDSPLNPR